MPVILSRLPPDRLGFFSENDQRSCLRQCLVLAQQLLPQLLDPLAVCLALLVLLMRALGSVGICL